MADFNFDTNSIADLFDGLSISSTGTAASSSSSSSSSSTTTTTTTRVRGSSIAASSAPPQRRRTVLVDTEAGLKDMLREVARAPELSIDCEGLALDRLGKLCLMSLSPEPHTVFLIDVSLLGAAAFDTVVETVHGVFRSGDSGSGSGRRSEVSVRRLLEDPGVRKLLYDVRCDSDALYHQYGVRLQNVLDLQVAEVAVRRHCTCIGANMLLGLSTVLGEYLPSPVARQWRLTAVDKTKMVAHFQQDPQFWDRRPLTAEQVQYAADDVAYLHPLKAALMAHIGRRGPGLEKRVISFSATRTEEYDVPYDQLPKGKERARAPRF